MSGMRWLSGRTPFPLAQGQLGRHTLSRRLILAASEKGAEAQRGELLHRRIRLRQADMEESLPAGVPLHKRGFGVMDELS